LADRDEALRLNTLSLQDIDDAAKDLEPEDYKMLKEQFVRQRDMAKASKLQLEAIFRYRIEKLNASEKGIENRQKLETCLQRIEKLADEVEQLYGNNFPFLKASMLREYTIQVREEVAKLQSHRH
jgi:5'-deoxynucleotidase YfbR-like HD superfamily hydrolase